VAPSAPISPSPPSRITSGSSGSPEVIAQTREGTAKLTSLRRDDLGARFPGLLDAVPDSQTVAA
jgi:hypothetical protein